jgi:hypothetical protein
MSLFSGQPKGRGWWADHSLSIVLVVLMVAQTAYAIWSGAIVWAQEDPFQTKDPALTADFWVWWSWEYNVSLVADTFGVLLVVLLTKWLYERDSAESTN